MPPLPIDVHVHVNTRAGHCAMMGEAHRHAMEAYYRVPIQDHDVDAMAADYRRFGLQGLPIAFDAETATGNPPLTNDAVAAMVRQHPDVFPRAWACVDPWKGEVARLEAVRAIKELGLIGLKFQANIQRFLPNERQFYPLYEECSALGVPIMCHVGTTGYGAGLPGGGGVRLKHTHPMPLDDIAADFPNLMIIASHPAWPWQQEMIAIALHKPNVYMELSGWAPKYFPEDLKREVNSRLQDKVMFGSDYPYISPERWLREFQADGYRPQVVEKVLYQNALRILKIKRPPAA